MIHSPPASQRKDPISLQQKPRSTPTFQLPFGGIDPYSKLCRIFQPLSLFAMKLPQTAILIGAALQTAAGLPSPEPLAARACTTPKLRREWSKATQAERTSYINAVKCLTTKPSKIGLDHRLYDDFVFVHATLFNQSGLSRKKSAIFLG